MNTHDHDAGEVLGAAVPVGVAAGGRAPPDHERDEQRHGGQRVGDVVQRVAEQRDRAGDDHDDGLERGGDAEHGQRDPDRADAFAAASSAGRPGRRCRASAAARRAAAGQPARSAMVVVIVLLVVGGGRGRDGRRDMDLSWGTDPVRAVLPSMHGYVGGSRARRRSPPCHGHRRRRALPGRRSRPSAPAARRRPATTLPSRPRNRLNGDHGHHDAVGRHGRTSVDPPRPAAGNAGRTIRRDRAPTRAPSGRAPRSGRIGDDVYLQRRPAWTASTRAAGSRSTATGLPARVRRLAGGAVRAARTVSSPTCAARRAALTGTLLIRRARRRRSRSASALSASHGGAVHRRPSTTTGRLTSVSRRPDLPRPRPGPRSTRCSPASASRSRSTPPPAGQTLKPHRRDARRARHRIGGYHSLCVCSFGRPGTSAVMRLRRLTTGGLGALRGALPRPRGLRRHDRRGHGRHRRHPRDRRRDRRARRRARRPPSSPRPRRSSTTTRSRSPSSRPACPAPATSTRRPTRRPRR